jgi:hypothetical protein
MYQLLTNVNIGEESEDTLGTNLEPIFEDLIPYQLHMALGIVI